MDKSFGSSMRSIGSSMTRVGKGMSLAITAPVAIAGAAIIKMGADYDQALTNAVSVTGKTGKAAEVAKNQMNELALQLGAKTAFSAKDAAEAMYDLASSGWDVGQMQKGLNGIMDLASATQTDLADATGAVVSVISQFGLKASDSTHVADVFTAAINKSRIQMDDLQIGMKYAGPIASSFGVSLEETTAILSQMADAGIEGSTAGTSLRAALSSLGHPIGQAQEALFDLGLTAADVNPQTHSLAEIMDTLGDAGMSTSDAIRIFGREAAPAMLAVQKQGVPALQKLTKELKNSAGTAARTAKMQRDTLKGAWDQLSGSAETLAIKLEQRMEPALIAIMHVVTRLVNWMGRLPAPIQAVLIGFAAFAAAIGPIVLLAGLLASSIGVIAGLMGTLGIAATTLVVGLGAFAAVAVGVAAAGIVLYKNWSRIKGLFAAVGGAILHVTRPAFNAIGRAIRAVAGPVFTFLRNQAQFLVRWWQKNFPMMAKITGAVFGLMKREVQADMKAIATVIRILFAPVVAFWRHNNQSMLNIVKAIWNSIKTIIKVSLKVIFGLIRVALQLMTGNWRGAWKTMGNILQTVWKGMIQLVKNSGQILWNIIKILLRTIADLWNLTWGRLLKFLIDTCKKFNNTLTGFRSWALSWLKDLANNITKGWNNFWQNAADFLVKRGQGWGQTLSNFASAAVKWVKSLPGKVGSLWEKFWQGAANFVIDIKDGILNTMENLVNGVKGFWNGLIGFINKVLAAVNLPTINLDGSGGKDSKGAKSGQSPGGAVSGQPGLQPVKHARGGIYRADGGGIAGPGRMGLVGEAREDEAIVNLERYTPQSAVAYRAAMHSPAARKVRREGATGDRSSMSNVQHLKKGYDASGATSHNWVGWVADHAYEVQREFKPNVSVNTYARHGTGDFWGEQHSVDHWGPGGRGAHIRPEIGDQVVDYVTSHWGDQIRYYIWQGMIHGWGQSKKYSDPSDQHFDHVHVTYDEGGSPGGLGAGGESTSLWDSAGSAIWNRLVQPRVDDMVKSLDSGFILRSAAGGIISNTADAIKNWIIGESGSSSGTGDMDNFKGSGMELMRKSLEKYNLPSSWATSSDLWNIARAESGTTPSDVHFEPNGPKFMAPWGIINPNRYHVTPSSPSFERFALGPRYVKDQYGTPEKAWSFHESHSPPWYDAGGLIKRDHQAMVHANELVLPLDNIGVARAVQKAVGADKMHRELQELRRDLRGLTVELGDTTIVKQGHINKEVVRNYVDTHPGARHIAKQITKTAGIDRLHAGRGL